MKSEQLLKKIPKKIGILGKILKIDSEKRVYWELGDTERKNSIDSLSLQQTAQKVREGIQQIYTDYVRNLIINSKSFNTFKQWLEWLRAISEEEAQQLSNLNQLAKQYVRQHSNKLNFNSGVQGFSLGKEEIFLFSLFLRSELRLSEKSLQATALNYQQGVGDTFTLINEILKVALIKNYGTNIRSDNRFTRHYVAAGEYYAASASCEFSCVDSEEKSVAVKHKKIPATGLVKVNEGRAKVLEFGGCVALTEFAANLPAEEKAREAELKKMTASKVIKMIDEEQDQSQREFELAKQAFNREVKKRWTHLAPPKWWRDILIAHKYVDKIAKLPDVGLPRYTQALRKMTEFLQNKSKISAAEVAALVEFYYTSLVLNRQDKLNALMNNIISERYSDGSKESARIAHKLRTIIFKHLEAIVRYEPHHFNAAIVVKEFYKGLKKIRNQPNEAVENYFDTQIEIFENIQQRQLRQIHSKYQKIVSAVKASRLDIHKEIEWDKLQRGGSRFFGLFGISQARAASAIMFKMEYLNETLVEFMKSPGKLIKHLIAILENNHDPMGIKKVFEINLKKHLHSDDVISVLKKLDRAIDILGDPAPALKSEETHSHVFSI